MMVITIKMRVMIAKKVIDGRAGKYCTNVAGEYILKSLKQKYAIAAKKKSYTTELDTEFALSN